MHIDSKLTKYVLSNNKGSKIKESVIYCKFYSPEPILTSIFMGTRFTIDFCHYSLPFIRSIKAHRLPFIANMKS